MKSLGLSLAVIIFWGWQTQLWPFALLMITLLIIYQRIEWRWQFTDKDFNRIADICTLLLIGTLVYQYNHHHSVQGLFRFLQIMPAILFLLLLAQYYSQHRCIKLSALFWSMRRSPPPISCIDMTYPWLILCVLSASTANTKTIEFFIGFAILLIWSLWIARPTHTNRWYWLILVGIALVIGYAGQIFLYQTQTRIEDKVVALFENWLWGDNHDPYRQDTAIGDIGKLKTSDRILFRVQQQFPAMLLLREASYNHYYNGTWSVKKGHFTPIKANSSGQSWQLQAIPKSPLKQLSIYAKLSKGKGVLTLPQGVVNIKQLPVLEMQQHNMGAVKVAQGPNNIHYTIDYTPDASMDQLPVAADLVIPALEQPAIDSILATLLITNTTPKIEALNKIQQFFAEHFQYSLILDNSPSASTTPLAYFLLNSKQGHCEYFATATALLLRAAGIPTRYVSGYSVQEYSELEHLQIVRQRHAHAWVQAYINHNWQNIDTTPSIWASAEAEQADAWQPILDLWNALLFHGAQWLIYNKDKKQQNIILLLLLAILISLLSWRLLRQQRIKFTSLHKKPRSNNTLGTGSAFDSIIKHLEQQVLVRHQGETLKAWITRLQQHSNQLNPELLILVKLHYHYRFDPQGLSENEKHNFEKRVSAWLKR